MTIRPIINGGVYFVNDSALTLPPNDERDLHRERRPVVVVSGPNTNSNGGWRVVLVAPISSSSTRKTGYCVKLAAGEGGVSKKCWVRVVAIQPLIKGDLQDYLGVVPAQRLEEIQARLFQYMGLSVEDLDEPDI